MIIQVNKTDGKYKVKKINKENIELQTKTAIENGDVKPDAEYYGLDKVVVNTPIVNLDDNIEQTIDVSTYSEPVEITSTKDGMKKTTITLNNIPVIENNKEQTIDVMTYTEPVEITSSNDGMKKVTITLENTVKKLYYWKFTNTDTTNNSSNVKYIYFPFSSAREIKTGYNYTGLYVSSASNLSKFNLDATSYLVQSDTEFTKTALYNTWTFERQASSYDLEY